MRYRWGFIEEGVFTECKPIVDDETALDFSQEAGQIFYRAKLNGSLSFRFEFDDILSKGYNFTHIVALEWYDNTDNSWKEAWRGHFSLTDCEIDFDTNTISVQPETEDRYTNILNHLEDEYNLIKLSPNIRPVNILIRPLLQVYEIKDTKISNYVGNNYWESECQSVERNDIDDYKFGYQKQFISVVISYKNDAYPPESDYTYRNGQTISYVGEVIYGGLPQESTRARGTYWDGAQWQTDTLRVRVAQLQDTTMFIFYGIPETSGTQQQSLLSAEYEAYGMGTAATITIESPSRINDAYSQWDMVCARFLVNTEDTTIEIGGNTIDIYDIPANDMAGTNANYNKTLWTDCIEITLSSELVSDPTEWGESYIEGKYFTRPTNVGTSRWIPVGRSLWKYFSVWYRVSDTSAVNAINNGLTATQRINDCFAVRDVVFKLLDKAGWTGTNWISKVLGGSGENFVDSILPIITPKSNVISSYYDTPAQNAPISLSMIFTMLREAYKIYWYIDANNDIHFEHISFFDNGYQYTEGEPGLLVDLESVIHTRTYESKVFGQNKVRYDKQEMPEQYAFSWMDKQTIPFDGFPIKCLDKYVSLGTKTDENVGNFSADVDYVLSSPGDVSRDGFVLFALPLIGEGYPSTLTLDTISVKDEAGDQYDVTIQNADAAFIKIHESYWRFHLPCESILVNNEETTARSTGSYKLQAIEFADLSVTDIIADADNCGKLIRTQQGDGHIKTLSINLNSLAAKADLLFNFVGRWYYLRGTALGSSISIYVNGELVTIEVSGNTFKYRYNTPISALNFNAADVVSVNFADCDNLDNLTSTEDMFKSCAELLAVDFGNKRMSAVTDATDMFAGCAQLTTLICPATSSWKADLNFEDCPLLTTESIYSLIGYLFDYESGVHTLTFNQTMWDALDPAVQTDIETKANAKGWQIAMAASYFISGHSTASVVYATIDGNAVEIEVENGAFNYGYRSPITSISFEGDANVTDIDFSMSDGLAGLTSLDNAFKNCSSLTSVIFTNCDLTNVVSASDCFANCGSLVNLTIPSNSWKADVDFSSCILITYAEMLDIIGGLYTYTSGVHTITWNTTYWDSLTQAQQQTISDAADAKGWTTNSVVVVYVVRGTSTNVNGTETFNIQFIDDGALSPSAAETITCAVDAFGNWEFDYQLKKIYSLGAFATNNTHITSVDFTDAALDLHRLSNPSYQGAFMGCSALRCVTFPTAETFSNVETMANLFYGCVALTAIDFPNATFGQCTDCRRMLYNCTSLATLNLPTATFAMVTNAQEMFNKCCTNTTEFKLPSATFANVVNAVGMFADNASKTIELPLATMANCTNITNGFLRCTNATEIDLSTAVFSNVTNESNVHGIFKDCTSLVTLRMDSATFDSLLYSANILQNCTALLHISVPTNATAIAPTATPSNTPIDARYSPLTYQSMINLASWVRGFSGQSAHTMTFKASAWNALSSAEQTNIDTILSGKNWNRAIA